MPSPDLLKIKCFTPIPSVPEIDLDGKMLTKDATTKDCLFTMTEYLSENVLQSIPQEFRIKQFFDKGLFKSFRKQNPHNYKEENPKSAKEKETLENPKSAKEKDTLENLKSAKEKDTLENLKSAKEKDTLENPESAKEKEGEENTLLNENTVNKRQLISTYRKIINHNIRLILNTLFQKNNKIVIKGNTFTIGYYNWTDYDWDIDAKRPTFDKQQYVTSAFVKQQLGKIPPILKHGLVTTNDKLSAENDYFSVTAFDNEDEAIRAKEVLRQGQTKQDAIELDHEDNERSRLKSIKLEKSRKTLGLVPGQSRLNGVMPQVTIKPDPDAVPDAVPNTVHVTEESNLITQKGGELNENKSDSQRNSFNDSRRSLDSSHRSSFDSRRRYDPRYDPRYRSQSKMVNIDESNFAIYISVEIYLVKGDTLTPEDESNLNCKNNWNEVIIPFDKLIGREKRGVLPDYSLEPTSKPESPKSNGTKEPELPPPKEPVSKEPVPTNAHGGTRRHRRKTLRRKKRKPTKKNKHIKRKAYRTTRKRKSRGSRRK